MFKAVAFRIIVEPEEIQETIAFGGEEVPVKRDARGRWLTPTGIDVSHAMDEKLEKGACVTGTILDIGEDAWAAHKTKTPFADLKVGDKIYFAKYAGKWIVDSKTKKEYLVINDDDVVCKIIED